MAPPIRTVKKVSIRSILLGLLLISLTPIAYLEYGKTITFVCTKNQNGQVDCVKQTRWPYFLSMKEEVASQVTQVSVKISCSSSLKTRYRCYSNVLVLKNEEKTLETGSPYFNEKTAAEAQRKVKELLRQPGDTPLVIACDSTFYNVLGLLGVGLPLLGSGIALLWAGIFRRPVKWFIWS